MLPRDISRRGSLAEGLKLTEVIPKHATISITCLSPYQLQNFPVQIKTESKIELDVSLLI